MRHLLLLVIIATFVQRALSKSFFIEPEESPSDEGARPDVLRYTEGQTVEVRWSTDIEKVDILLCSSWPTPYNNGYLNMTFRANDTSGSCPWTVKIPTGWGKGKIDDDLNGTTGIRAFFVMIDPRRPNQEYPADTVYFNILEEEAVATNTTDPIDTSNNDDGSRGKPGLSSGAMVGISVGATVAGLVLISALGFLFWRRRRNQKVAAAALTQSTHEPPPPEKPYQSHGQNPSGMTFMDGSYHDHSQGRGSYSFVNASGDLHRPEGHHHRISELPSGVPMGTVSPLTHASDPTTSVQGGFVSELGIENDGGRDAQGPHT